MSKKIIKSKLLSYLPVFNAHFFHQINLQICDAYYTQIPLFTAILIRIPLTKASNQLVFNYFNKANYQ